MGKINPNAGKHKINFSVAKTQLGHELNWESEIIILVKQVARN
jgi:hypothetical protein